MEIPIPRQLTFAVSGHPEYRFYDNIDAQIISFEKECAGGLKPMKYGELNQKREG